MPQVFEQSLFFLKTPFKPGLLAPAPGCFETGTEYPDHEILSVGDVFSVETCQKICAQHQVCAYLSYDTGRYTCRLHHAEAARRKAPSEGHIAAPATCNAAADASTPPPLAAAAAAVGVVANVDFRGNDLRGGDFRVRGVESALECHRRCLDRRLVNSKREQKGFYSSKKQQKQSPRSAALATTGRGSPPTPARAGGVGPAS